MDRFFRRLRSDRAQAPGRVAVLRSGGASRVSPARNGQPQGGKQNRRRRFALAATAAEMPKVPWTCRHRPVRIIASPAYFRLADRVAGGTLPAVSRDRNNRPNQPAVAGRKVLAVKIAVMGS